MRQITSARADVMTVTLGATVRQLIDLHLGFVREGAQQQLPALTMDADQARNLALLLQAAADKAAGAKPTASPN